MTIPNVRQEVDVVRQIIAKVKAALSLVDVAGNPCQSHIGSTDVLPIAKLGYMLGVNLNSIVNEYGQPALAEDLMRPGQYQSIHVNTLIGLVENQIQLMYNLGPIAPTGVAGAVDYGQQSLRTEAHFGPPPVHPQPQPAFVPPPSVLPQYGNQEIVPPVAYPQQPPAPATFTPQQPAPVSVQPQQVDPTMAAMFGQQQAAPPVPQAQAPLTPGQQLGYEPLPGAVPQQAPIPINPAQALGLEPHQQVAPQFHEPTAAQETAAAAAELKPEPPRRPGQSLPSAEGKASIPAIPAGLVGGDAATAFANQSEGHIPTMVDRIPAVNSSYMMVDGPALDQMMTTRGISFDPGEDKSWKVRRLDAYDNAARGQLSLAQSR